MIQVFVLAEKFHKHISRHFRPLDEFLVAGQPVKLHPKILEAAVGLGLQLRRSDHGAEDDPLFLHAGRHVPRLILPQRPSSHRQGHAEQAVAGRDGVTRFAPDRWARRRHVHHEQSGHHFGVQGVRRGRGLPVCPGVGHECQRRLGPLVWQHPRGRRPRGHRDGLDQERGPRRNDGEDPSAQQWQFGRGGRANAWRTGNSVSHPATEFQFGFLHALS